MKISAVVYARSSVVLLLPLLIFSLTTGCSSDDDGGAVSLPATVPDQLNYTIRQEGNKQLTLTQESPEPGQNPSATVTSTMLTGTFNRNSQAFTLDVRGVAMSVSAAGFLNALDEELAVDTGEEAVDFSNYSVRVISAVSWVGDGNPTSGEIDVVDDPDLARRISIRVIAEANGQGPGVEITLVPESGDSLSVQHSWAELDGLLENQDATAYAKIAAFAYNLLRFMYEQGELVILALEFIGDNDVLLEETGPITETCDTFPRLPDPEVPNPGTSTLSWSDVNTDNSAGPGDTFILDFANCWDDDETAIDTLYHGMVEFVNYTEDASNGVITRVGFEQGNGPGGISFSSLQITETEDDGSNILIFVDELITLNGGFSMVFTSP